jgi:uracil phosphoribosyltransferase
MASNSRELDHRYGEHVHILENALANSLLARLCSPATKQPQINLLVQALYHQMVCSVISNEMPSSSVAMETRMITHTPKAIWRGDIIDPNMKVVVVCIARAGIYPSQVCYDFLNTILDPDGVRQDHMLMNRTTDEKGHVSGAAIHGAKIGGPVDGATLLIPDPMGATGTTIETVLDYYQNHVPGKPSAIIPLNLIITPEYIRSVTEKCPSATIYSYRVDRGLSSDEVLASTPGERWAEERGLNDEGYIVPGGGGFGEIMNNSFV